MEHFDPRMFAVGGVAGLEASRRERPNLIICDSQLPGMSGLEVVQHLKAEPQLAAIPLLDVTAFAMVEDRDWILESGFEGYIHKPIDPEAFVQQIKTFLSSGRPRGVPQVDRHADFTPQRTAGRLIILEVDDNQVNLKLARSVLEPHGYRVLTDAGMFKSPTLVWEHLATSFSPMCAWGRSRATIHAAKSDPRLHTIPFVFITSTLVTIRIEPKDWLWGRQDTFACQSSPTHRWPSWRPACASREN